MALLRRSLERWPGAEFGALLVAEFEALPPRERSFLQQASQGWTVDTETVYASFIDAVAEPDQINARLGVHFTELVAGCGCGDDVTGQQAYCEVRVLIDRRNGDARFVLPGDRPGAD